MGKLFEGPLVEEFRPPQATQQGSSVVSSVAIQVWREPLSNLEENEPKVEWESVNGLTEEQKKALSRLSSRGVYWKHPSEAFSSLFFLYHGGDVEADGNCLFSAAQRALRLSQGSARDLRIRVVQRFLERYDSLSFAERENVDRAVKHLYSPDLQAGWGVHFLQEVKLLASKSDRATLDGLIEDLVRVGMEREVAAESIYKERCISVDDGASWAKYMSVSGSPEDEYDIITLQYAQDGLLSVDENRAGRAAAFGDDIAIESLATEFKREIFVAWRRNFLLSGFFVYERDRLVWSRCRPL
eukprot:TRINITY_DN8338_c0_g2_i2.p1 TRINITY_DN8338_c0_g2~~TRINITY_DN8338_c0_g2_i2.p1  ORF type:complete len:299 (-),score=38.07 TRINITY_DN8338_c0_g2_i2:475-1371(-)